MIKCEICGREFKNFRGMSLHIVRKENLSVKDYYDRYLKNDPHEGICLECGKETHFNIINKGYYEYCSSSCVARSKKTREKCKRSCFDKYGVENPFQSKEIKEKIRDTNLEKFGVDNPSQSEEIQNKKKETCLKNYGVEYSQQSSEIREKAKKTCIQNHGVEYAIQSPEIREKQKQSCLKNYGVENPSQSEEIKKKKIETCLKNRGVKYPFQSEEVKEKIKQTCLDRYGVDNPNKLPEIREKSKQTCLKKYGVNYILQCPEFKEKTKQTCLERYGSENPFGSKEIIKKLKSILKIVRSDKLFSSQRILSKATPLFEKSEYNGCANKYKWECNKCKSIFEDDLENGHIPRCPTCYPYLNFGVSKLETEVFEFCSNFLNDIERGNKDILGNNKQIDIYSYDKKLGIEFNGLFWHSEIGGKKSCDYHLEKTEICKEKDIQLIHIFEDEWVDKREIVESILKAKMRIIDNNIYARKCEVVQVLSETSNDFLENSHIQGSHFGKSYGLSYNNEIVSILTVGKSRFNKNYEWEIYRFCNKLNTSVVGGFSKLLKYFIEDKHPNSIITYADKRYSDGSLYNKNGFEFINTSEPNYYYMDKNYNHRQSRQKFQKHKLKNLLETFDPELTEWQNMQLNGYDRIWDCGNLVFGMNL